MSNVKVLFASIPTAALKTLLTFNKLSMTEKYFLPKLGNKFFKNVSPNCPDFNNIIATIISRLPNTLPPEGFEVKAADCVIARLCPNDDCCYKK